jgi:hypothetical protein
MSEAQINLLICLISAHIIGDFILQSNWIAENKKNIWIQLLHASIIAGLSYLLCGIWKSWLIPLFILLSHFVIDFLKSVIKTAIVNYSIKIHGKRSLKAKKDDVSTEYGWLFLVDQILHLILITIFSIWILRSNLSDFYWINLWGKDFLGILILISGFTLTVWGLGFIINYLLIPFQKDRLENNGFKNGGRVIGFVERATIFLLIVLGEVGGIGFLIAAKTLFRFGEIQKAGNRKEAEYILIGTLFSFFLAIFLTFITILVSSNYFQTFQFKILMQPK